MSLPGSLCNPAARYLTIHTAAQDFAFESSLSGRTSLPLLPGSLASIRGGGLCIGQALSFQDPFFDQAVAAMAHVWLV